MKKQTKKIITTIILTMLLLSITIQVKALGFDALTDPDGYKGTPGDSEQAAKIADIVVWLIKIAGRSIAVVMLIIIGMKYIMGSVEERAEYKKTTTPLLVGAILIFAGTMLVDFIYGIFQS